ncbi:cytochrome P450 [Ophiobolus disseminans]|uniref:Cytochrome P450 n=1 Tax=Ophiobolus disseminans TaxID=1469910 RepID=A0A6A6ZQ51_9PLEO|nr:cytochrome P450 [Ophiobolus disseminans]
MPLATHLLALAIFAILLHRISLYTHRLLLSPLRSIPGPLLSATSRLPLQLTLFRGTPHTTFLALHKHYGPIVRIAPNQLGFFTAQSFKDIYGSASGFTKDPRFYNAPVNGVHGMVTEINDKQHARMRRVFAPGFTAKALIEQEELIVWYVDALLDCLAQHALDGPLDVAKWLNAMTFDITSDLLFGESFGCLAKGKIHPWIEYMFTSVKALVYMGIVKQFPWLECAVAKCMPGKVMWDAKQHYSVVEEKVGRRLRSDSKRTDFMAGVARLGAGDEAEVNVRLEKGLSRAEVCSNAYFLTIAGSETVATALSGTLYYLCKSPSCLHTLTSSIRTAFPTSSSITFSSTNEIRYLKAVINEGLRIYPPFAHGAPRLPPPGGAMVDGIFVHEGVSVAAYNYATYHSPTNFYLADEFHPERWLGTDQCFANDVLEGVQPFSLGTRGCIGKTLAYAEMRLTLAKLLWRFDVKLRKESEAWDEQRVYYLWDKGALMVDLIERE